MDGVKVPSVRTKAWPLAAAIVLNLIPVAGVVFWGWSAFALIFLYWLENVVIGVRTAASIVASAALGGGMNALGGFAFAAFFTVHYGLFCLVHGSFVVAMFGDDEAGEMLDLIGVAGDLFAAHPDLLVGLASISVWQLIQFILFLVRGGAGRSSPMALMAAPYPRIFILHITIIFGGFVLLALREPIGGVVLLALIKTGYDVAELLGRTPRLGPPSE